MSHSEFQTTSQELWKYFTGVQKLRQWNLLLARSFRNHKSSPTRTRPAGARKPAVRALSWAGLRADVAWDAGRFRSRLRRLRLSCHPGLYENGGPRAADGGRRAAGGEGPPCAPGAAGAEAERSAQAEPVSVPAARASRSPAPGGASALPGGGEARSQAGRRAVERARAVAAPCAPRRALLSATPRPPPCGAPGPFDRLLTDSLAPWTAVSTPPRVVRVDVDGVRWSAEDAGLARCVRCGKGVGLQKASWNRSTQDRSNKTLWR